MGNSLDFQVFAAKIPATGTAVTPIFHNITANGVLTLQEGYLAAGGAGSVVAYLIYGTANAGTIVPEGTLAIFGTGAATANMVYAAAQFGTAVISSAKVFPNKWVAVQTGSGTAGADSNVILTFIKGQ